jgi:hypothetical protein
VTKTKERERYGYKHRIARESEIDKQESEIDKQARERE